MLKLATLLICGLCILFIYRKGRLISSTALWILCYLLIFIVYPLYETKLDFLYGKRIDIYALIGIIAFFLGLVIGAHLVIQNGERNIKKALIAPKYEVANVAFWCCFVLTILVLIKLLGVSGILAILTGRMTSKQLVLHSGGVSMYIFSVHLLVPCVLALWISAENKIQKLNSVLCLGIYMVETILFGFTRIFLISILAMIIIYEIRNMKQQKQLIVASACMVALLLLLVSMNFIRTFGLGSQANLRSMLDLKYIFESTDFSASYYWFDRMLNLKPLYINPNVYLKPILAFVPRSIWANKPEPLSMQILLKVDPVRVASGYSTAGNSVLGEGYAILGPIGIFVFPFLWGMICGKLDKNYYERLSIGEDRCLYNIFYYIFAVFVVISGQRGDWCQYMTIVIWFYMLPMYLMSKFSMKWT